MQWFSKCGPETAAEDLRTCCKGRKSQGLPQTYWVRKEGTEPSNLFK